MKKTNCPLLTLMLIASLTASAHAAITGSPIGVGPGDPNYWDEFTDGVVGATVYGGDGTLDVTPPSTLLSNTVTIGLDAGVTGYLTVDGTGAGWTNGDYILVGSEGTGTLDILGGAYVSSVSSVNVGDDVGGTGTLLIDDSTLDITGPGILRAGNYGTGTVTIRNGGVAISEKGRVGHQSGSDGTATVNGVGSSWTTRDDFIVGGVANIGTTTGVLNVEAGGVVQNGDYAIIGYDWDATGTVTVTGSGSQWNITGSTGRLEIGRDGTGALNILDGGYVSCTSTGAWLGRYDGGRHGAD